MNFIYKKFLLLLLAVLVSGSWGCDLRAKKPVEESEPVVPQVVRPARVDERKKEGAIRLYYENGQIQAERQYQNSKLNGPYREYYENGTLKTEGLYKDDQMDGTFRYYAENGSLKAEEVYKDNFLVERKTPSAP
ncbi:MAG: hypothetical protein Q8Q08_08185 [Candidatus Omnitrophota bacterium]|nr:hypothetical protein [Candidatus Omnitrophota bacterium]MDZ4242058.1 hypothetical protein [Candidatus Omnitrophota bacterium]